MCKTLTFLKYFLLLTPSHDVVGKYMNPGIQLMIESLLLSVLLVINSDFPDPGVLKLPDGSGYLGVVSSGNVPDAFPLISSPDLVTWTPRGHVFPAHSWPDWVVSELWAPEIHFVDGR